jgi:hypothetical protein
VGYHCWPDAPEEVSFLRSLHRHLFFVELEFITTEDRQLEFFIMKRKVTQFLQATWHEKDLGSTSCEVMAHALSDFFEATIVRVFEDNENGGVYYK